MRLPQAKGLGLVHLFPFHLQTYTFSVYVDALKLANNVENGKLSGNAVPWVPGVP